VRDHIARRDYVGGGFPAIHGGHQGLRVNASRFLASSGPSRRIRLRPFLPQLASLGRTKTAGTLRRSSIKELFSPQLFQTTVVTALLFAAQLRDRFWRDSTKTPQILAWPKGHIEIKAIGDKAEAAAKTAPIEAATKAAETHHRTEVLAKVKEQGAAESPAIWSLPPSPSGRKSADWSVASSSLSSRW